MNFLKSYLKLLEAKKMRFLLLPWLAHSAWVQNLSSDVWTAPFAGSDQRITLFATVSYNKIGPPDVVSATFYTDFYVYISWRDDRFLDAATASSGACFQDNPSLLAPGCVAGGWTATIEQMNAVNSGVNTAGNFQLTRGAPSWVGDAGGTAEGGAWVTGWSRCSGQVDSQFNLASFPFDSQTAPLMFESTTFDATQLTWSPAPDIAANSLPRGVMVDGWDIQSVTGAAVPNFYPAFNQTYSRFIVAVKVKRKPMYWLTKYVMTVTLIFSIALASGTITARAPDRMALTVGAFFGIVSMLFVLVQQMPVLGYSTALDTFFTVAFICTFSLVAFNAGRLLHLPESQHLSKGARRGARVQAETEEGAPALATPEQGGAAAAGWKRAAAALFSQRGDMLVHCVVSVVFAAASAYALNVR